MGSLWACKWQTLIPVTSSLAILLSEAGSLTRHRPHLLSRLSGQKAPRVSTSLVLEYGRSPSCPGLMGVCWHRGAHHHAWLFMGACRIRTQDLVCATSPSLTEPSPQPPIHLPLLLVAIAIFKSNCYDGNGPQMFLNNDIYALYPAALVLFFVEI